METTKETRAHAPAPTAGRGPMSPAAGWFGPALAVALALSLPLSALAQQGSVLPGVRSARNATNIAPPTPAEDSFMGQEKTGPYVLTWRKFLFGPGNPVWVLVDGRRLNGAEYAVDAAKGEITFAEPLKRTQIVRVSYGYYPEMAERNPNPALSTPLSMTLASLGIGELKMSTLTGINGSATPRVVLGLGSNRTVLGGGLTSQIYLAPDQIARGEGSAAEQAALKLGYTSGNDKNGFNVGFQRGGRAFSQSVGRSVGAADAVQNLNVGGRLNPNAATSLSFNRTDNRNLLNPTGAFQQNAALRLGGLKGQPALNFARTEDYKTDAKGINTGTTTEKGDLGGKFGAIDLAYRTSRVETALPTKQRTEVSQNVLSANLPGGKSGLPTLGFTRTEDGKVDPNGARTETTTDVSSLSTRLGAASFTLRDTQSDTILPDRRRATTDQRLYGFALPGATRGFRPALNYTRIDTAQVDGAGNRTDTAADQADFAGKFGIADVVAKLNRSDAQLASGRRAGLVEQQNLAVKLAAPKQPALAFTRTGDVKIDANGLRVGTVADQVNLAGKVKNVDIQFQSLLNDTGAKDGNRTAADQNSLTLRYGGDKGRPAVGFFRTGDERRVNDGNWFGAMIDRYVVDHRLGALQVGYQLQQTDVTAPSQRQASGDLSTFKVALPAIGARPGVDFQRQSGDVLDPNATRTGLVADQIGVTSRLSPTTGLKAEARQTATEMPDPLDSGVARENAFTLDRSNKKTAAAITLSNAINQTGRQTDEKQGINVTLKPMPNITLGFGQKEQAITPAGAADPARIINSQSASAEVLPLPGTRLFGARTNAVDGASRSSITDLAAKVGTDKTALKIEGSLRDRAANTPGGLANADTANASFQVRPASNLTVTGAYLLNPEDPKKPGTVTPVERREYGVKARLGAFEVGGSYAATEHLAGTPADVIAKAGGAPQYGEMGLQLGWRFGSQTQLTGQYKDTFFNGGAAPKGLEMYTLGFTHSVGSRFSFSLNGTLTNNRAIVDPTGRTDYRAEAKLGVKF